ncbi:TorF family putative porin [uncultured Parabacteroides sp.]|uniref:TorF family putative porin n=1 Tax=uncultured Parabacteroides sp. TaxID=512312 RepID=UPI0025FB105D|nr:TorF family putative porin [uncultured Parabacteroides sp.]
MNSIIKKALAVVITVSFSSFGMMKAQDDESGATFNVQGDLVSSYIWRGMYQTGASFQPTFSFGIAGFSLTAWGSTDFDGYQAAEGLANKEIDLTAAYTFANSGLILSVADLWWAGQGANKYFNFKSHETAHHFEAGLAYTFPVEKFPLSVAWYTMFAGQDKDAEGGQNYSSYVELNYPFSVKRVDLNVTCGLVPYKAPQYCTNGFAVTNVALKGTTAIKVTDSFSLPIFAQAIWNPRLEDAHLVFGFTLKP